jgi:hypothetical protein
MAMTEKTHAAFKKSQSRSPSKSNFSVLATRGGQEKQEIARWGEVRECDRNDSREDLVRILRMAKKALAKAERTQPWCSQPSHGSKS